MEIKGREPLPEISEEELTAERGQTKGCQRTGQEKRSSQKRSKFTDSNKLLMIEISSELWYNNCRSFCFYLGGNTMARPKKNGTYLNVCIETTVYERLEAFCNDAGQTKTVAVERALQLYLDDYDDKQRKLKELERKN